MNLKFAEAALTNENSPMKEPEKLHEDPEGRALPGTLDAPWGEPGHVNPMHNGKAAWDEFIQDGPKLLAHAFDGYEGSRKGEQNLMGAYFDTKDYESRSPLLRKYAEAGHIPSYETIQDRVRALKGIR
jgi:hypothetical protein